MKNFIQSEDLSLYIHWPFCLSKCPYCDFNSHVNEAIDHQKWLDAYLLSINNFVEDLSGKKINSIFFGGGTPSLMPPKLVESIIDKLGSIANFADNIEITLEANPTSSEAEKFKQFRLAGINRVSIGVQALNDNDLQKLGRSHSTQEAISVVQMASTIFDRLSFDLIYARSGQTLKSWQEELKLATEYAKGHISLYQLTIEKGTPFYKLYHNRTISLPDVEVTTEMYEWTNSYLKSFGYDRYEISNYAIDDNYSRHNMQYWLYRSYLGIGPGAHSRIINSDSVLALAMYYQPESWLNKILSHNSSLQVVMRLDKPQILTEILMMGLRLPQGIDMNYCYQILGEDFVDNNLDHEEIRKYEEQELLKYCKTSKRLYLTDQGLMLHSYILPRIIKC